MITQEELKKYLRYDTDTGFFIWRIKPSVQVSEGNVAGTLMNRGYIHIGVLGKAYRAHRLAFLYMTGAWPKEQVDHINGNRIDNRWCNLREATQTENQFNVAIRKDNTSGYKGVSLHKRTGKWAARCGINNKDKWLGIFDTPELAAKAYQEFAKKHHKQFYRTIR